MMSIELKSLKDSGLIDDDVYIPAALVLRKEHRMEEEKQKIIGLDN